MREKGEGTKEGRKGGRRQPLHHHPSAACSSKGGLFSGIRERGGKEEGRGEKERTRAARQGKARQGKSAEILARVGPAGQKACLSLAG